MAGSLQLAGAQSNKPPKYASLYSGRWYSGIVTQRAPLRSAGSMYEERYVGSRGDALIDGGNCEVTPKLTLARRPGNSVYNSNTFPAVDSFYSFREFIPQGANAERIRVMADTASVLYDATAGGQIAVFNKSAGSGQTFMQSVKNTLFFADGIDQKKWVQSLFTRTSGAGGSPNIGNSVTLRAAQFPFISTYLIDSNGNLQELYATVQTTVSNVTYVESTNTLTLTVGSTAGISADDEFIIWDAATATWLDGITLKTTSATGVTWVGTLVDATHADYASTPETAHLTIAAGGTPVTGGSVPTWNTTVPAAGNLFQGGSTIDGTALWMNRGNPIMNWGISILGATGTDDAPTVVVGTSTSAWKSQTFFSLAGAVIDTQFGGQTNIWQVTAAGKSGSANPFTSNPTSGVTTVTDGTVTWECVASTNSGDAAWTASTVFAADHLIVANAAGTDSLFQLQPNPFPVYKLVAGQYITAKFYPHNNSFQGQCELRNPADGTNNPGSGFYTLQATGNNTSVLFNPANTVASNTSPLQWATITAAGNITGTTTPYAGATPGNYTLVVSGTMTIPKAGQYSFTIFHDDGMYWGVGNGATRISGPTNCPAPNATLTALNGYNVMGANNVSGVFQDSYVVNFPTAGDYPFEIDFAKSANAGQFLALYCNGQTPVPGAAETGTTEPTWPAFSTAFAPNYATVSETNNAGMGSLSGETWNSGGTGKGPLSWANLGPITDAVWQASTGYTLPDTTITDPNNNTEGPFRAGVSGTTTPTFATGLNQLTLDNPNLIWINLGPASAPAPGTISAFNGGYQYTVALVNTATDTVSNGSPLSPATGNFIGAAGITITGGLPPTAEIDVQSDYVAIFRTTDGESVPFLIPGTGNSIYTVSLAEYLANGYLDTTPDTGLNNLIEAPILGENTPPGLGAQNLTYHLNRIFFSIGNTVYWTSGPDTPVGNGVEGVLPTNNQVFPSLVKRIVPTTVGAFVFTVSDVYVLVGQASANSPIAALPYGVKMGLLNYNALDIFGSSIGFFASDKTFNVLDISNGPSEIGFNIGDQLQKSQWNPATAYVTWHSYGEDKAWFISDDASGWYRINGTPAPEQGITISPFATIVGGVSAVQSIETSPGVIQLLSGPGTSGPILARDLTTFQDNGQNYTWFATIGSLVLANPGQLAEVAFVTFESKAIGTPPSASVILDEAVPDYTGPFEPINEWVEDPPTLPRSKSIYAQRFYLSLTQQPAYCRHMQVRIDLPAENIKNEAWTVTIFGALQVEN